MGIIRDLIERQRAKRAKQNEAEDDVKIARRITEKQKNANERELERYYEEERQRQIADELRYFRKQRANELWHDNKFTKGKYLFKSKKIKSKNIF